MSDSSPFTLTQLPLSPEEIMEAAQRSPKAQTFHYGTKLIRVDISAPCSLYIHGEDGFRLTIAEKAVQSPDEIINEFAHEGMTASYHYADDTGKEWKYGDACKERALALAKAHPELLSRFREISKKFLWAMECERRLSSIEQEAAR